MLSSLFLFRKSYNDAKNRAHDLVPLEASRVGLTPKPCVEGSDYINASWLQVMSHWNHEIGFNLGVNKHIYKKKKT